MSDVFLAFIAMFGGNFAPRGWALCWGQIVSIAQNSALFSLLGTTFGGNGQTTFALPDLRGRMPIGWGNGPGLSSYSLGQPGGTPNVTILTNNMPIHTHAADLTHVTSIPSASTAIGTTITPDPTVVPSVLPTLGTGPAANPLFGYVAQDNTTTLAAGKVGGTLAIAPAGGSLPMEIMNPFLAVTMMIALQGVYPSRN